MPGKKNVAKQVCFLLEDQKQAELSLGEEFRITVRGMLGQGLITPWVMEGNETTVLQISQIATTHNGEGLHASSLGLEEPIDGSLSSVHFQTSSTDSASHSSWIDTKRGVSGEGSSSHVISAGSCSYRLPCHTIHSTPTSQLLGMKSCQVATQEQVSGGTETVYTRSVEHQGCSTLIGMHIRGTRSHADTQSALYDQMLDQSSWINSTLESSRQNLGGLRIIEPGADTPSNEPVAVTNYFNSMNCIHQEMKNGSEESVTEKNVPVGNQVSEILSTTQDMQGIYKNYANSSSLQNNIGKVQRDTRFRHSVEPYQKMTMKARELLKKKQIQEQLDFVDNFHGICPKLVYIPAFSTIQENENLTPPSPTWPGK